MPRTPRNPDGTYNYGFEDTGKVDEARRPQLTRLGKATLLGAGVVLSAGGLTLNATGEAGHVLNEVKSAVSIDTETHVDHLKDEFKQAKANPEDVSEGKYVWFAVNGGNPTTIARAIAKPGEVDEVRDELIANEVSVTENGLTQDILPVGNALLVKSELRLDDPLVLKGTSEFDTPAPQQ